MFGLTPYNNKKNNSIMRRPGDPFDFDSIFESFFNDSFFPSLYRNSGSMKVDIKENDNEYVVEAELPGIKKEEINIDLHDDRLTISVEKKEEDNEERDNYIRRERRYGSMSRSFSVSNIVNEDVKAKFENGILSIILPKKEPGNKANRRIEIQ